MTSLTKLIFPETFFWGAATAGHQIEGNNIASDWWTREHMADTDVAEPSGDSADSYHRYKEDIRLLAESGLQVYRLGIEWARVEPEEGCFSLAELAYYRQVIETCHEYGVEPMVTVHHFSAPLWFSLQGGWTNDNAISRFERYVKHVLPILHDVKWICTINEPNMEAKTRYGSKGNRLTVEVADGPHSMIAQRLVEAHKTARRIIKTTYPDIKVGWTIACQDYHAMPGCEQEKKTYEYPREDYFTEVGAGDDFIGVQAYLRTYIGKNGAEPVSEQVEKTLTGWEYYPPALSHAVEHTWHVGKHTPIIVTENGLATSDDSRRIDYTYDSLRLLHEKIAQGIEVQGYIHWSLIDNYEWGSFTPTFGLIGWDKTTFERRPKKSLYWLGNIAKKNSLEIRGDMTSRSAS